MPRTGEKLKRKTDVSPIPPGFFSGMGIETVSLTGKESIETYLSIHGTGGFRNQERLVEMLYCDQGCHNRDGVVMDES